MVLVLLAPHPKRLEHYLRRGRTEVSIGSGTLCSKSGRNVSRSVWQGCRVPGQSRMTQCQENCGRFAALALRKVQARRSAVPPGGDQSSRTDIAVSILPDSPSSALPAPTCHDSLRCLLPSCAERRSVDRGREGGKRGPRDHVDGSIPSRVVRVEKIALAFSRKGLLFWEANSR